MQLDQLRRREVITLLGGAATWPVAARAQQPVLPVIGFLRDTSAAASVSLVMAFRQGLKERGFIEGQNLVVDYRWSDGQADRLPGLASELVRRPVAVLVAANLTSLVAAKSATQTIPIVFVTGDDPVLLGFVSSLSRPAGNITGVSFYSGTLGSKQIDLLRQMVPSTTVIGMLVNPTNPAAEGQIKVAQAAVAAYNLKIIIIKTHNETELYAAFDALTRQMAGALLIGGDALFTSQSGLLATLAARHVLPTIHFTRQFVASGGLMSYGSSITDAYRLAGVYSILLLKGAKPSDLPVMLPTKFELSINLKTAKTFGLAVPASLLALADEVIE